MSLEIFVLQHTNGYLFRRHGQTCPAVWTSRRGPASTRTRMDPLARPDWEIQALSVELPREPEDCDALC